MSDCLFYIIMYVLTYVWTYVSVRYSLLSRKYFLCSTNYSKFHLSKSVIFNEKFWIFLFFSFFVSFFLSFILILIFVVSIFSEQYWLNNQSFEHDGQVRLQIDRIFLLCHCKYFTQRTFRKKWKKYLDLFNENSIFVKMLCNSITKIENI